MGSGYQKSEKGFTLLEILMGVTILVFLATITVSSIEPTVQRARLEKTKDRLTALSDGIKAYYSAVNDFPLDRLTKSFKSTLERGGILDPHPLDALAVNPFSEDDDPDAYDNWNTYGPFVSSEFEKRSYLYDGWSRIIKYICPFPYDEAGRYDETVLAEDGTARPRALIYSVGSDGKDNLVNPDPSDPFVEISWDKDVNIIVIPPLIEETNGS